MLFFSVTQYLSTFSGNSKATDLKALNYSKDSVRVELNNGTLVKNLKSETTAITNIGDKIAEQVEEPQTQTPQAKVYNTVTTPAGERVAMFYLMVLLFILLQTPT